VRAGAGRCLFARSFPQETIAASSITSSSRVCRTRELQRELRSKNRLCESPALAGWFVASGLVGKHSSERRLGRPCGAVVRYCVRRDDLVQLACDEVDPSENLTPGATSREHADDDVSSASASRKRRWTETVFVLPHRADATSPGTDAVTQCRLAWFRASVSSGSETVHRRSGRPHPGECAPCLAR
jgi:hypothetical protein